MNDNPEGESLSQSEAERPPAGVPATEATATVVKPGGHKARFKLEDIQPCDFRQPAFLTSGELRRIRLRHEEFVRSLAAQLSTYIRMEATLQITTLQTLSYKKYVESLAGPTHLTLFKVEPLKGVCLLDLSPRLGLSIVDRLLGGSGQTENSSGNLSEIETALLDQVALLILNEWCQLWQKVEKAYPVLLGHENSGRFLNTSPHDSVMLILSVEVRLASGVEQMQLAFPFLTIEALIRQSAFGGDSAPGDRSARPSLPQWNPSFDDVRIRINTEWHGLELTAGQLTSLKCGDVLLLDPSCFDRVEVRFERQPKFQGRLGRSGTRLAVELINPVKI